MATISHSRLSPLERDLFKMYLLSGLTSDLFQVSILFENGPKQRRKSGREHLLQRGADQVFRPEGEEKMRETLLVGKMREVQVPQAGCT